MPEVWLSLEADMTLRIDWCGHDAALHAVRNWHYSRSMPAGKVIKLGVWENGGFIGAILFSRGANNAIGSPYGLKQNAVCELTRIALRQHKAPVSRMVSVALRFLKAKCPGLRLVVSYAASERGHHGGVYQAGNWIYEGPKKTHVFIVKGRRTHAKTLASRYGACAGQLGWLRENVDPEASVDTSMVRHKYLMGLDEEMKKQIAPLHQSYPKRVK